MTFKITVAQPVHAPVAELLRASGEVDINPGPEPFCAHELIEARHFRYGGSRPVD
jgi:hypothetical protein